MKVRTKSETEFDANGRVIGSTQVRELLDAEGNVLTLNANQGTGSPTLASQTLSSSRTHYNPVGQVDWTEDRQGLRTYHVFDVRGQEIESRTETGQRNAVGELVMVSLYGQSVPEFMVTRTVYDEAGRAVFTTDSYLFGTATSAITGSHTVYDVAGRVTSTQRLKGVAIAITSMMPMPVSLSNPYLTSVLGSVEADSANPDGLPEYEILSTSSTTYGAAG